MAILFNGTEPFEQIVKSPETKCFLWNLAKIGQVVLEKTLKDNTISYMYIATEPGQIILGGHNFHCN